MKPALTVYKASAGSGKTFTLAIQYIKMLTGRESCHTYSHILAVTFTNKATAEMKDRILGQLYGIWKGLPSSAGYMAALGEELRVDGEDLPEEEIRRRAGTALLLILHDYDRFRVETIDSFFQSVMRNLAHELGLTADLRPDLNDKEVLGAAVDRIMERLHLMPAVLDWILEYVEERIANNERWDVAREIKDFASCIFKEAYLAREDGLREALREKGRVGKLRSALNYEKEEALDIVQSAAANFRAELEARSLGCGDFCRGGTIDTYLRNLENGKIDADFCKTLQGFTENPETMLRKGDRSTPPLVEAADHFSSLLADLRRFQTENVVRHNSAVLALKHLNPLRLLDVIDEEVAALDGESNCFRLAKTPVLLHELIDENDTPFILEKMGAFFRHVMIDEFQDTSAMQWKNFKILLKECMASGNGNLIVGDVKQSIYRFRNGDWTILKDIEREMGPQRPEIRNLSVNFRSACRIVAFNNALFAAAARELDRLAPEASVRLTDIYADVEQQCPPGKGDGGYVRIRFFDKNDKGNDAEDQMLDDLCGQVRALHEAGLPYGKMTILLRHRKHIAPIVRRFAEHFGDEMKPVSDEAFLLSGSPCVNILVAAMRYMADADDRVSLAFLALHGGKAADADAEIGVNILAARSLEDSLPDTFVRRIEELRNLPLYELQEELYRIFDLGRFHGEDAYLLDYLDRVTAYVQENPSDIRSFLNYWDETLSAASIPSGEVDGIRILTVHQSKGLQFHTVFVPYCDWPIERDMQGNRNSDLLWCETHEPPYDGLPVIPVTAGAAMRNSVFRREYEKEHLQRRVDELNALYVTFTRAAENLFVWCRTRYAMAENSTTGDLVYSALPCTPDAGETTEGENGKTSLFTCGEPVAAYSSGCGISDNRMETSYRPETVAMRSYEARIDFCPSVRAREFLDAFSDTDEEKPSREDKRRTGILMHKIFSTIRTRDDVEKALLALETEGRTGTRAETDAIKRQVADALRTPEAARWFDGTMKPYNECPILTREYHEDTGRYDIYRPDRVMFGKEETIVVDFKFGNPRDEYRDQIGGYMKQLRLMEPSRHVRGYLWYIPDNRIEEVKA